MLVFAPVPPPPKSPSGAVAKRKLAVPFAKLPPKFSPLKRKVPRSTRASEAAVSRVLPVPLFGREGQPGETCATHRTNRFRLGIRP
jgi:hypothetical protein